jgi:hypothetical protein
MKIGIGPGGEVVQEIKKDDSDPRLWDIANSKLISIHLIDSTVFSSMVGYDITGSQPSGALLTSQTNRSQVGVPSVGVGTTFGALYGVEEWNRLQRTLAPGPQQNIDHEVDGWRFDGLNIDRAQRITTFDADDTLPGM